MEFEMKDMTRHNRRRTTALVQKARLADYRKQGQLVGLYEEKGWDIFLSKNRFGYKTDDEFASSKNDEMRLASHRKTHAKVKGRVAVALALAEAEI